MEGGGRRHAVRRSRGDPLAGEGSGAPVRRRFETAAAQAARLTIGACIRCNADLTASEASRPTVMKVPRGGGKAQVLATAQGTASSIVVDAGSVYWVNGGPSDNGDYHQCSVLKVPIGGGTPQTLASGLSRPSSLTVDATSVYWLSIVTQGGVFQPGMGSIWKLTPK